MLNLSDSYALHGKFFFDPRVNLRWTFPRLMVADRPLQFEIGGGAGWHTMTPSLTYLYPDLIYYDWQQLNYYHSNPAYRRLNLKTYVVDPTNYDLQAARNFKWEIRGDISYGENRFTVTYFRENLTTGFRNMSQYQIMNYRQYDASGIDPGTLTAPPQLENLPYKDITAFGTYGVYANGTRIFKEGVEYSFTSKRIPALRTRITIDGDFGFAPYTAKASLIGTVHRSILAARHCLIWGITMIQRVIRDVLLIPVSCSIPICPGLNSVFPPRLNACGYTGSRLCVRPGFPMNMST